LHKEIEMTDYKTPKPHSAAAAQPVYVCWNADHECGDRPTSWCADCPKRATPSAAQPVAEVGYTPEMAARDKAILDELEARGWPDSPMGAARAGWYAAVRATPPAAPEPTAWQPCLNCGLDGSTGRVMHAFGCPNDPQTFKMPAAPAAPEPLTDEQVIALGRGAFGIDLALDGNLMRFARAIERAHGIGERPVAGTHPTDPDYDHRGAYLRAGERPE
jgi:hypothetical protein